MFLETNIPSGGKKKSMLGVSDAKIGAALQEELNLSIQTGGVVAEIIRGEHDDSNQGFSIFKVPWTPKYDQIHGMDICPLILTCKRQLYIFFYKGPILL